MRAHEAWAFARPHAESLDPQAKLVLITSGTDIQADGRSFTWEFLFRLPRRQARLLLTYAPADDAPDVDRAPVMVVTRVTTAADRDDVAVLPLVFRDSPEVIAEFARGGVDFVAGPTDMKLEARISAAGQPVWVTCLGDEARTVDFTPSAR
jgi:hypothetical protein